VVVYRVRVITTMEVNTDDFTMSVSHVYFGVSHLVLETSQQMTDIPYGDYFRVEV
jgi:hypothetical protein